MAKGSAFEREICKALSLWWTQDKPRDDVYWRSSNSGGRATIRSKKGNKTFGSYGDIAAVDPIGQPLLQMFTIELKRGYSSVSFADLFDKGAKTKASGVELFIEQAILAHRASGSISWMLVQRRDKKQAVAFIPARVFTTLTSEGAFAGTTKIPYVKLFVPVRIEGKSTWVRLVAVLLSDFFAHVKPAHVKATLTYAWEE